MYSRPRIRCRTCMTGGLRLQPRFQFWEKRKKLPGMQNRLFRGGMLGNFAGAYVSRSTTGTSASVQSTVGTGRAMHTVAFVREAMLTKTPQPCFTIVDSLPAVVLPSP